MIGVRIVQSVNRMGTRYMNVSSIPGGDRNLSIHHQNNGSAAHSVVLLWIKTEGVLNCLISIKCRLTN